MVNFLNGSIQDRINYIKTADWDFISDDIDALVNYDIFDGCDSGTKNVIEIVQGNIKTVVSSTLTIDEVLGRRRRYIESEVTMYVDGKKTFKFDDDGGWIETTYDNENPLISIDTWHSGYTVTNAISKNGKTLLKSDSRGWIALFELDKDGKVGKTILNNGVSS